MTEPLGKLSFVSLLRRGLAAGLETKDEGQAGGPSTALNVRANFGPTLDTLTALNLVGPGDIVGLDSRVVVRTFPRPDEGDAEFEHFALIEFDQADLPWRYTPAKENDSGQLRPWVNLLVLEEDAAPIQPPSSQQKLPILTADIAKLPDLTKSWAWAHTQVEGTDFTSAAPGPILDRLDGTPGLFVARIVSPRVLEASKSYVACLVPTFERGRLIGIGTVPSDSVDALQLAWTGTTGSVQLPVYYFWRFKTGTVGSFKELAKKIRPAVIPKEVGRRDMVVSQPGLGLPRAAGRPLAVEGALQSVQAAAAGPTSWTDPDKSTWINQLKGFLSDPKQFLPGTGTLRVVGPPLYGQWYAAASAVTNPRPGGTNPPWFYELDTDPRSRVGAALGTTVIQNEQEALLASGWKQVGELPTINYERKVLQLGREMSLRLYARHVLTGSQFSFFLLTGSLHGRVLCGNQTVCVETDESRIGRDLFDPSWRRWTRTWGWLGRRQGRPSLTASVEPSLLTRLNNGERPAPEPGPPGGLVTSSVAFDGVVPGNLSLNLILVLLALGKQDLEYWGLLILWVVRDLLVSQHGDCYWLALKALRFAIGLIRMSVSEQDVRLRLALVFGTATPTDIQNAPKNPTLTISPTVPAVQPVPPRTGATGAVDSPDAAAFRLALIQLFTDLQAPPTIPFPPAMDLETCRLSLAAALNPSITVAESMTQRLVLDPSVDWRNPDDLQPIFAPPEYEQPMYGPLSEVSKDWILPGLNQIKRDTAGLAVTNQRFIEAYMVGLNHEMTRELLWNEFPTDQRGTYFRQFWDTRGIVPPEGFTTIPPEAYRDIKPIRQWSRDSALGGNSARSSPERLVLVVRAQLIERYPNVIVYAVQAQPASAGPGLTTIERHPVFYALLQPDVAFYGFDLTAAEVKADPGWYFVLQEQPGEPKFFVPLSSQPLPPNTAIFVPTESVASDVASDSYEVPFRVGIHGSTMIPET